MLRARCFTADTLACLFGKVVFGVNDGKSCETCTKFSWHRCARISTRLCLQVDCSKPEFRCWQHFRAWSFPPFLARRCQPETSLSRFQPQSELAHDWQPMFPFITPLPWKFNIACKPSMYRMSTHLDKHQLVRRSNLRWQQQPILFQIGFMLRWLLLSLMCRDNMSIHTITLKRMFFHLFLTCSSNANAELRRVSQSEENNNLFSRQLCSETIRNTIIWKQEDI